MSKGWLTNCKRVPAFLKWIQARDDHIHLNPDGCAIDDADEGDFEKCQNQIRRL
jgi:hypothetical protein